MVKIETILPATAAAVTDDATLEFPPSCVNPTATKTNLVWEVHKFGGTSVANADCFLQVTTIIENLLLQQQQEPPQEQPQDHGAVVPVVVLTQVVSPPPDTTKATTPTSTLNTTTVTTTNIAVVVSAMGGKPIKTTDLLLGSVQYAAQRNTERRNEVLQQIYDKHETCINALFHINSSSSISSSSSNEERHDDNIGHANNNDNLLAGRPLDTTTTTTTEAALQLLQRIRTDLQDIRDILQTVSLMKWHSTRISELISG